MEGFAWRQFGVSPRRTRTTGLLRRLKFAVTTASTCSRRSQSEGAGWCEASSAARRAARSSCRAARRPRTPTVRRRGRRCSAVRRLPTFLRFIELSPQLAAIKHTWPSFNDSSALAMSPVPPQPQVETNFCRPAASRISSDSKSVSAAGCLARVASATNACR
jgi:hypothetical protein